MGGWGGAPRDKGFLEEHPRPGRTLRLREMSEVRAPRTASSMILVLLQAGRGRPFTKRPPSWFTLLGPGDKGQGTGLAVGSRHRLPFLPQLSRRAPGSEALQGEGPVTLGTPVH